MVALIEKIARDGGATREAVRKETAKPKAGPAEGLRLQLQGPDQGVQPAAALHQVARRPRRSHRRAPGHHQRAQSAVTRARFAGSRARVPASQAFQVPAIERRSTPDAQIDSQPSGQAVAESPEFEAWRANWRVRTERSRESPRTGREPAGAWPSLMLVNITYIIRTKENAQ